MSKGSRRNPVDVAFVSTGLKGGGGVYKSENECPLSFRAEVGEVFRTNIGSRVRAQPSKDEVIILCDQQEMGRLSGKKGERIARCIADSGYKYEGVLVRDKDKLYAELQVT